MTIFLVLIRHLTPIDRVPKRAWLQVTVMSRAVASYSDDVMCGKNDSVNGKFIRR